jgi:hypothetical protein
LQRRHIRNYLNLDIHIARPQSCAADQSHHSEAFI